jgi:acyl-CoA thioester hydrolase
MPRLTLLTVAHPWHCDAMGHMNVRHYAAMFDDASFQLLGHLAGANTPDLGWADVRCETDYRSETKAGTLLSIESELTRLGRSSISYRHVMTDTVTGERKAEAQVTTIRFDLKARRSVALSDDERLRAGALIGPAIQ